ncbi:MAG: hypothetical protein AAFU54_31010 [Chloroflexota bacterium]
MQNDGLPQFKETHKTYAVQFAQKIFGDSLIDVHRQGNGYFRVLFEQSHFTIQPGNDAPSKSQWSTLKKRMKRVNKGVFILRKSGTTTHNDRDVFYMDFGFLEE